MSKKSLFLYQKEPTAFQQLSLPSCVDREIADDLGSLNHKALIVAITDKDRTQKILPSSPLQTSLIHDKKVSQPLIIVLDESDDDDWVVTQKVVKPNNTETPENKNEKTIEIDDTIRTTSTEQLNNESQGIIDTHVSTTNCLMLAMTDTVMKENLRIKSAATSTNSFEFEEDVNELSSAIESNTQLNNMCFDVSDTPGPETNKRKQMIPVQNQRRKK
ncbi:unnamed protein product, partial [Didymodactylos carnosus]